MEELLKQAPSNLNEEIIKKVYDKNNGDYMKSLLELWDIEETTKEITKEQKEWNNIRETCDCFDIEMTKLFKKVSI